MGKAKKSTKKFNQKHLKGELERRNSHKKNQQLIKKRELKKGKRSGTGHDQEEDDGFTGIEEVDSLAEFAESSLKGAGANMDISKFMEADPNNDDDSTDEEDLAALLGEDDDDEIDADSDQESEDGDGAEDEDMDSDEEAVFKQQFEAMKEKDPEFFKFMQNNDPEFMKVMNEADASDDSDEENEEDEAESDNSEDGDGSDDDVEMDDAGQSDEEEEEDKPKGTPVTVKMLSTWENSIKTSNSLKSFKQLMLALHAASHMESEKDTSRDTPFRIEGVQVFNKTISTAIRAAPPAFAHFAPIVNNKVDRKASGKKWKIINALIKSYLTSLLELIKQMSDPMMIQYLIKESERMIPYFGCYTRFTRDMVKEMLRQFGSASADDNLRVLSLLIIRQLVEGASADITDMALKGIYLTYVRSSNVKNVGSLTTIQLMRNCGVELYGNDANASYQHAFVYIRQLAIHLRNSMQLRSKESFRAIYNWQFINSLSFWTEVLATYCGDRADEQPDFCATLESLIYPLTQIILGVVRLVPTSKFFPLRIHCLNQLLRLSSSTGIYIPVIPLIIEILESPEFTSKRPVKSTLKRPQLETTLKASKEYEHTRIYLEVVLEYAFDLLADAFASQSVRIAFPEWSVPAVLQIKRWRKRAGKSWSKFSKQLQGLLEKVDQTSRLVEQNRSKIEFAPGNMTAANQFMNDVHPDKTPVGAYAASLRKVRAQQRATLVEAEMEQD
ncbi:Nucleolar Complex 2 protein [Coemansia interrupta]|uniref:Nucleolar Complex 2 protein n=1 Tax=Coemansia interrupta TaxID=1126814 RepID=A0A9W8LLP8_9FUNG|nr:Nucleolar Complex 2 protein [Coemansia interrupta]